jgi:hypothetical protein
MGDNAPPPPSLTTPDEMVAFLNYRMSGLLTRRDEVLTGLRTMLADAPKIENDDDLAVFTENRRMAETLGRTAEDRRKEQKGPVLDLGRVIDQWFQSFMTPVLPLLASVRGEMDRYAAVKLAEERRIRAERAAAAEAEAARRAAEAQAALASQTTPAEEVDAKLQAAEQAERQADVTATRAAAPAADMTRVRGDYGAVSSARETLTASVADITQVPVEFLTVDMTKVNAAVRELTRTPEQKQALRDGKQPIPGILVTINITTRVR